MSKPGKIAVHGVVLLDKPQGMTSNGAMKKLRWHFNALKAGHTGSLDPMATGLLPICFGQATKVSEYFLNSSKRYTARVTLGQTTDTYDAEGEIRETKPVNVSSKKLEAALQKFRGSIMQQPPMYSALKRGGQPLYKLARQGKTVDRPKRPMTVFDLSCTRLSETELEIDVHCSSGFYVRSLAYDLGEQLGCGGHLSYLRRTEIKSISVDQAVSLDVLLESELASVLQPLDSLLGHLPCLAITEHNAERLLQGQTVHLDKAGDEQLCRIYIENDRQSSDQQRQQIFAVGRVLRNRQLKTDKIFVLNSKEKI